MARPALIVFDLDGTLIDSRKDLADSANATLGAYGLEPLPEEDVTRMVGEGARVLVERAFSARGVASVPSDALATFLRLYDERLFVHTRPYEGVVETLPSLASMCRLAVLTNKPQNPSERLIAHFGLAPCFARILGGGSRFPRKPDPSALEFLVQDAGAIPAQTLMVGDSWIDHETATRAGARSCVATWGFGFAQIPPGRLRGDELLIDRMGELLTFLQCA